MSQKTTLWIAAALTAFVLVIGGAVAGRVSQAQQTTNATSTADVAALMVQREAEYQALLKQANDQLTQAYNNQPATSSQVLANQTTPTSSPERITAQQAMSAAVIAVPGAKVLQQPELVNFQGTVAYEVRLDQGSVYINASNGAILYNGATQQVMASNQSPAPESGHSDDGDGDHDDDHDDDHGDDDD